MNYGAGVKSTVVDPDVLRKFDPDQLQPDPQPCLGLFRGGISWGRIRFFLDGRFLIRFFLDGRFLIQFFLYGRIRVFLESRIRGNSNRISHHALVYSEGEFHEVESGFFLTAGSWSGFFLMAGSGLKKKVGPGPGQLQPDPLPCLDLSRDIWILLIFISKEKSYRCILIGKS